MAGERGIRSRSMEAGMGLPVTTKDLLLKTRARSAAKVTGSASWLRFLKRPSVLCVFAILLVATRSLLSGSFMADLGSRRGVTWAPGSVYRSHIAYSRFAVNMTLEAEPPLEDALTWDALTIDTGWRPCAEDRSEEEARPYESNGYIVVVVNGGLNQQRSAICNGVAVARLLNATLVIPHLYHHAIWKDPSTFEEIYDVQHFIDTLSEDIKIARHLPTEYAYLMEDGKQKTKVSAWSSPSYYLSEILPLLRSRGALRLAPFANRLSYDDVPSPLQRLRCRANFHALQFSKPIHLMADTITKRMAAKSPNGQYVAVHLRFEKDMVAFSHCLYDGGVQEREELAAFREVGWNGKFTRPGRTPVDPAKVRRSGKCPLTPLEVGLVLRGMGFPRSTPVYLAAGKIYGGIPPALYDMFPAIYSKETLLTDEELAPFKGFSSRLAALDYTVCVAAQVFMATQGGNFPQIVEGHRRYLNRNHWKTISPDKKQLALLLDNQTLRWSEFRNALQLMREENDLRGVSERKRDQSLYSLPAPECMCRSNDTGSDEQPLMRRGRNLGLGDLDEERNEAKIQEPGTEEQIAGDRADKDTDNEEDVGANEGTDGEETMGTEIAALDQEGELEQGEEEESTAKETGRIEMAHEVFKAWALIDDRPRVGRRLPVEKEKKLEN